MAHRQKPTDIDNVLPAVAELGGDQPTVVRWTDLDSVPRVLDFANLRDADPWPLPMPIDREGYCTVEHSARYWALGRTDWMNVQTAMERHLQPPLEGRNTPRVLDFGCATGRFLRHLALEGQSTNFELWGCDISPQNIDWAKRYLDPKIRFRLTDDVPPLAFDDGYFDVVTAFSVLTHIGTLEEAWLAELLRITKPDGLLYVTVLNEASWKTVPDRGDLLHRLTSVSALDGNLPLSEQSFREPMPDDKIVHRTAEGPVYNCCVFHSNDHIHKVWGRFFEILDIADRAHTNLQAAVILRPRRNVRES